MSSRCLAKAWSGKRELEQQHKITPPLIRWADATDPEKHSVFISSSPSGWTNNDIGLAWLKEVFDRETRRKARTRYRLLLLDGHGSHLTMEFLNYCHDNKILLAVFPPHSTHTLQPLDVGMFTPLNCLLN